MKKNTIPKFNSSKCPDPTAYAALNSVYDKQRDEEERVNRVIRTVKWIIDLAGFDLVARIEIRDKESGNIYK